LWVVDPSNPTTDHMTLELQGGGYGPLDWSPDDRTILLGQGVSVNESYLWLVNLARGEKTLLAPQPGSEPVAYRDAKFSRDGKGIYLSTDPRPARPPTPTRSSSRAARSPAGRRARRPGSTPATSPRPSSSTGRASTGARSRASSISPPPASRAGAR